MLEMAFLERVEKGDVFDVTNGNLKSKTDLKIYNPVFNDFRREEQDQKKR